MSSTVKAKNVLYVQWISDLTITLVFGILIVRSGWSLDPMLIMQKRVIVRSSDR